MEHRVGGLVCDFCRRRDGEAGPFLHGRAVDGFLIMLSVALVSKGVSEGRARLTLKVIHEMGSSAGISVRFTRSRVRASSSNAKVKMAPGGVQVPTMRWWIGIVFVLILN